MSKKTTLFLIVFCVVMALVASEVRAQLTELIPVDVGNKRIGTAAASELLIPVGARGMAMGGATIATTSGINSIFWNPGGLALLDRTAEGMFSSMSYIGDITVNYGAVGIKFGGFGTIGVSIKNLSFGDIPFTTVDDPEGDAGRTFSPTFFVAGLTYAKRFTDAISAGVTVKLISEQMQRVTGSGVSLDIGIQYRGVAGIEGVNLGVALKNVGPQVNFDGPGLLRQADAIEGRRPAQYYSSIASSWELPTSVELGLAYEYQMTEEMQMNVGGSYTNNSLALDSYKVGGEAIYGVGMLKFAARGGYDMWSKGEDDMSVFGPSFGFGLTFLNPSVDVTIDYAYRSVDLFQNNSMFSVLLGF